MIDINVVNRKKIISFFLYFYIFFVKLSFIKSMEGVKKKIDVIRFCEENKFSKTIINQVFYKYIEDISIKSIDEKNVIKIKYIDDRDIFFKISNINSSYMGIGQYMDIMSKYDVKIDQMYNFECKYSTIIGLFTNSDRIKYVEFCENNYDLKDISLLFAGCFNLQTVNITNLKLDTAKKIRGMFVDCKNLQNVVGLENLNTKNVIDMSFMFYNCKSIVNLNFKSIVNVNNFNTSNVENMTRMFYCCEKLENINISNFITDNVTNMSYMFFGCKNLKKIDLKNFNFINTTSLENLFSECKNLTTIILPDVMDCNNLENTSEMFYNCTSLVELDLSHFYASGVIRVSKMFYNCKSLTSLDLSNMYLFCNFYNNEMFKNCSSLTRLKLKEVNK